MRKYPKKCPECGEFMEPVFEEGLGRHFSGAAFRSNPYQEPKTRKCPVCGAEV